MIIPLFIRGEFGAFAIGEDLLNPPVWAGYNRESEREQEADKKRR
jgi:hypothetical protein